MRAAAAAPHAPRAHAARQRGIIRPGGLPHAFARGPLAPAATDRQPKNRSTP
ncbi:hypothetical protein BURMUCGD1_0140 [Burkholderia multivorans CGD1]|nr:hypothetical protein BURMUCGD1_0140 [Burkholderia multivorans CGD1]